MRAAFLAAVAIPFLRSTSKACSISPWDSVNAALQSIMGAPLRSRNSFTWAAEIGLVVLVLMILFFLLDPLPTLQRPAWSNPPRVVSLIFRQILSPEDSPANC